MSDLKSVSLLGKPGTPGLPAGSRVQVTDTWCGVSKEAIGANSPDKQPM